METGQTEKTISNEGLDERFTVKGWRKLAGMIAQGLVVVQPLNDDALTEWRRDQCWGCDEIDKKNIMCKKCGCFLEEKTKAKTNRTITGDIVVTHCPLGKWNDIEIANHYNNTNDADQTKQH